MATKTNGGKSNVIITGTSKADSIANYGKYVTINAGSGNDSIRNDGGFFASNLARYVTINAGAGNDSIDNWSNDVTLNYADGDGNDTILCHVKSGTNLTVNLMSGTYSTTKSGDDVIIKVGKGSITFQNSLGNKISVKDSKGKAAVIQAGRTDFENTQNGKTITKTSGSWYIDNIVLPRSNCI